MTSPPPIDDELLSAHLDGATTAAEAARIDADPVAHARLEELRAARDLAATPVAPVADADLERMLAAALEAAPTATEVTDLAAARSRRDNRWRTIAAAAAAVVLLAIAVPVLGNIIDDGDDDTDSVALEVADESGDTASTDGDRDDAGSDSAGADQGGDAEAFSAAPAESEETAADEAEGDDTVDTEGAATEGAATEDAIGGPMMLADLAVLLAPLEPVDTIDELAEVLRTRLATADLDEGSAVLEAGRQALANAVASLGPAFDLCAELYVDQATLTFDEPLPGVDQPDIDDLQPVAAGLVVVDGEEFVAVVLRASDTDELVALLAPADTCEPVTLLPLDP